MADIQLGAKVRIVDEWIAPRDSTYNDAGSTLYAGETGVVVTQNTMGECLIKFDDESLGSYWIADEDCTPIDKSKR